MSNMHTHGICVKETATLIQPPITAATPATALGTAPIHLATNPAQANVPVLCHTLAEFVEQFGWSDDFDKYSLCEVAQVHFRLFNVAPVVFVNVLDTTKHSKQSTAQVEGVSNPATVSAPILLSTLKISSGAKPVEKAIIGVTGNDINIPDEIDVDNFTVKAGDETLTLTTDYTVAKAKITLTTAGAAKVDGNLTFISGDVEKAVIGVSGNDINIPDEIDVDNFTVKAGDETLTLTTDYTVAKAKITLTTAGAAKVDGNLTFTSGEDTYVELIADTDYTAEHDSQGNVVITVLDDDKVVDDKISLSYKEIDSSMVAASDIIGGVDINTGKNTGLELIEEIYPRFGMIPGQLIAPKWSMNSAVATIMAAKAADINGVFKGIALADVTADKYTDLNALKNGSNLIDPFLILTYPKVSLGGVQYHLSTQAAALMCAVDADNDDLPFVSPSNHNLQCDDAEVFLGKSQANYLNGIGIVTALNFIGGHRLWGNRTSAYPSTSDVKDCFISVRRMFNYIANTLVLSYWSRIDAPINRTFVESLVDEANLWLNALTKVGSLLGGRVEFLQDDNPEINLLDGQVVFRVYIAPPIPAETITFTLSYDVDALSSLFS